MKAAYVETLGCPRNQVDSEKLAAGLQSAQFALTTDPLEADVLILNTCAFLRDARREAFNKIRQLEGIKRLRPSRILAIIGCLPKLWGDRRRRLFRAVDYWMGTEGWLELPAALEGRQGSGTSEARSVSHGSGSYAYLKVAEGCNRDCSYCLIPRIKGPVRPRPRQLVLQEARLLAARGVWELILVAQDTTSCGGPGGLAGLLSDLSNEGLFPWIRVLYAHPAGVGEPLAQALATLPGVLPYLDMPIQHIDAGLLRAMGRWPSPWQLRRTVDLLRSAVPGIVLRTTALVGLPGEGPDEFRRLLEFLREGHFDHLGVFAYSREPGTQAFSFPQRVQQTERLRRRRSALAVQHRVRRRHLATLIGQDLEAVVDAVLPNGHLQCRPWWSAPDVDPVVRARGPGTVGERVTCRVEGLGPEVDLVGVIRRNVT